MEISTALHFLKVRTVSSVWFLSVLHVHRSYVLSDRNAPLFSVQMASCSHGVRTPVVSSAWGRESPASCSPSPSSLWQGFLWQRSPQAGTTALRSLCPELCLDGARTKLDSWVSMIFKVRFIESVTAATIVR